MLLGTMVSGALPAQVQVVSVEECVPNVFAGNRGLICAFLNSIGADRGAAETVVAIGPLFWL
jgi:hypothetical protein